MRKKEYKQALPSGHRIDDYRLLKVLGVGGFGITYLAEDVKLGSRVAIKEYLPNEFSVRDGTTVHPKSDADQKDFEWGLKRFLEEARTLAQFHHRNVVRVLRYFEANSTAYFVMEYEVGESLEEVLDRRGTLSEEQLRGLLLPLLDGLKSVHAEGFLHRDIKPSNIFVRRDDESPVLLDFGAARNALGRKSRSMTAVVTPGYSPPEQYETDGEQGPWTDIYALSALCFRAMTGNPPEESLRRSRLLFQGRKDPLPSLEEKGVSGYSSQFLAAVDWGLRIDDRERPRSVEEWLATMNGAGAEGAIEGDPQSEGPSVGRLINKGFAIGKRLMPEKRTVALGLAAFAALILAVLGTLSIFLEPDPKTPSTVSDDGNGSGSVLSPSFAVANESDQAISGVFVNSSSLEGWGANRLTMGSVVEAGHESVVHIQDDAGLCQYDVLIVSEGGLEQQYDDLNLCGTDVLAFSGGQVLTVANESSEAIDAVYASPDHVSGRGEDRLASGFSIPEGGKFRVKIDGHGNQCLFNVLVSADGGAEQTYDSLDLCEIEHVVFQEQESLPPPLASFTVEPQPPDARVRILNIGPPYKRGIPLSPGDYNVEVSAPGYETRREVVAHGLAETVHHIALQVAGPQVGDRFQDCPQCPEMVVLPAGEFKMGSRREAGRSRDEGPVREVMISAPFAIGVTEVTFAEWDACVVDNGCGGYHPGDEGWGRGLRPVINVSWMDADQYISWLSRKTGRTYRLLSEAEWEYAARAQTNTVRYWGDSHEEQCRYANGLDESAGGEYPNLDLEFELELAACDDGHVHTAPVDAAFVPNKWGLQHMLGNVWEWTVDCQHANYIGAPYDGSAWTRNCSSGELILRGGSWINSPDELRSAERFYQSRDHRSMFIGFRVARTLNK